MRLRSHLQETFTTERGGRPVLAVKASSRSAPCRGSSTTARAPARRSSSSRWRSSRPTTRSASWRRASRRSRSASCALLSRLVGQEAARLEEVTARSRDLDLALASAALSRAWDGCPVEPADEVDLRAARHPLLDPATAVPIDLPLAGVRALVVSGPNTGGKTVALKTLGLLAMLHQCGLRVPAARARLPVFDRVLADIGDDQSIAESLSTFSAHVRRLIAIMAATGPRSLVLLDEPAAGTDPDEGSRLAQAVVSAARRAGALVAGHDPPPRGEGVGERGRRRDERGGRRRPAHAAPALHADAGRAGRLARARHRGGARARPRGGGGRPPGRARPSGAPSRRCSPTRPGRARRRADDERRPPARRARTPSRPSARPASASASWRRRIARSREAAERRAGRGARARPGRAGRAHPRARRPARRDRRRPAGGGGARAEGVAPVATSAPASATGVWARPRGRGPGPRGAAPPAPAVGARQRPVAVGRPGHRSGDGLPRHGAGDRRWPGRGAGRLGAHAPAARAAGASTARAPRRRRARSRRPRPHPVGRSGVTGGRRARPAGRRGADHGAQRMDCGVDGRAPAGAGDPRPRHRGAPRGRARRAQARTRWWSAPRPPHPTREGTARRSPTWAAVSPAAGRGDQLGSRQLPDVAQHADVGRHGAEGVVLLQHADGVDRDVLHAGQHRGGVARARARPCRWRPGRRRRCRPWRPRGAWARWGRRARPPSRPR